MAEPTECEMLLAEQQSLLLEIKELDFMLEKAWYDLREVREKIKELCQAKISGSG